MKDDLKNNEPFDHSEEYERDIKPHIDAIWHKCKELNIPCLLAVNYSNAPYDDDTGTQMGTAMAVHFCGPARTPPPFVIASIAIDESPADAAKAVILGGMMGYRQEIGERTPASEDSAIAV